jgi:hypothetical protein
MRVRGEVAAVDEENKLPDLFQRSFYQYNAMMLE